MYVMSIPAYKQLEKCLCHYHTSYILYNIFYQQFGLLSTFFCRQQGYTILARINMSHSQFYQRE